MPNPEPEERPYDDVLDINPFFLNPKKYFANYVRHKAVVLGSLFALMYVDYWLIRKAFYLPEHSFFSEVCVVLATGIATFLATPVIIACASKQREVTVSIVLLASVLCGFAAYWREGALGSLLVEASVALLLLVALEVMFHHFTETVQKSYEEIKSRLDAGEDEDNESDDSSEPFGFQFPFGESDQDIPASEDDPKK
jgi:cytosine/uracil/thiamine/allantoin permease